MTGPTQHDATSEFNEALAAAFAANNFEALGPFFTEDASLLPPRGRLLEGRAAAAAFWSAVANRFTSAAFTTAAVKDLGDAARRETGTYAMAGADGQAVEGKYVFVWQLVEGEWQIETAIWNRNGEAGGRRQGQGQGQGRGPGQGRQGGQGGGQRGGQAGGQGGRAGYRGAGGAGGYRQGGGRPSFQGGGGGIGGGPGGGPGGGRQGGRGGGPGGGHGGGHGGGRGQGGGGSLYDGDAGLYSEPKD